MFFFKFSSTLYLFLVNVLIIYEKLSCLPQNLLSVLVCFVNSHLTQQFDLIGIIIKVYQDEVLQTSSENSGPIFPVNNLVSHLTLKY